MIVDQFIPASLLHFNSKVLPRLQPFFTSPLSPLTYFEEEASFCILGSCIFLSCFLEMNS